MLDLRQARERFYGSAILLHITVLLLLTAHPTVSEQKSYNIGFMAVLSGKQTVEKRYYIGAIEYAVRYVNEHKLLGEEAILKYETIDTKGDSLLSIRAMTEFYQKNVTAIIGPSTDKCVTEGLIASAWNKPLVSFVSIPLFILIKCILIFFFFFF